jgi:hypothetical protein
MDVHVLVSFIFYPHLILLFTPSSFINTTESNTFDLAFTRHPPSEAAFTVSGLAALTSSLFVKTKQT